MNLLITSAFLANGSPMTFINNILSTCQALAQTSTPTSPYPPYPNFSTNNQNSYSQVQEYPEFPHYPSRNIPLEPVITPAKEYYWEVSSQYRSRSESSLESLPTPSEEEYPLDHFANQAKTQNSTATQTCTSNIPKEEYPSDPFANQSEAQNDTTTSSCTLSDTPCLDNAQNHSQNIIAIIEETETTKNYDKATNFCWGKINAPELMYSSEDVIAYEFNTENDFEVELVKRQQRGAAKDPSPILKIKFKLSSIPETIKALEEYYQVALLDEPKTIENFKKTLPSRPRSGKPPLKIY